MVPEAEEQPAVGRVSIAVEATAAGVVGFGSGFAGEGFAAAEAAAVPALAERSRAAGLFQPRWPELAEVGQPEPASDLAGPAADRLD